MKKRWHSCDFKISVLVWCADGDAVEAAEREIKKIKVPHSISIDTGACISVVSEGEGLDMARGL